MNSNKCTVDSPSRRLSLSQTTTEPMHRTTEIEKTKRMTRGAPLATLLRGGLGAGGLTTAFGGFPTQLPSIEEEESLRRALLTRPAIPSVYLDYYDTYPRGPIDPGWDPGEIEIDVLPCFGSSSLIYF